MTVNADFVALVFMALVPPIWLGIGLIGLAARLKRRTR